MSTTTVKLQRPDPSQPWGFRIHGGVDFHQPLVILKVTAGSLSAQQGLVPGDQIITINGQDALRLRHREAQQAIISGGNDVAFEVLRGDSTNLQRVLNNEAPITIKTLKQKSSSSSTTISSNVLSTMVQSSSAVTTAAVTPGWGGPKYTEESIKESLISQASVLETGAMGVNFVKKNDKELDINKSEVLKMLNEIERERKERGRSPSVPPQQHQQQLQQPQQAQPSFGFHTNPGQSTFGIYMARNVENSLQAQQPSAPWATQMQLSPSIPRQPQQEPGTAAPVPVEGS